MIRFNQVSKSFGAQTVLDEVDFQINPGEHVGIVGPNGAGKSTVFNMIVGEVSPDRGQITMPTDCRIGYVHQQLNAYAVDATLLEYTENTMADLHALQAEIHALEELLNRSGPAAATASDAAPAERMTLPDGSTLSRAGVLRRLGELQTRFEHMGGYTLRNRAERMLCEMGFPVSALHEPFRSLSGGWQSRAELVRVLLSDPDILLLDEPSNYLDISAVERLQGILQAFRGTLLLISHDRFLLNSLTTVTLEIANARAERYPGNYDYYAETRKVRYEQRLAAQKNQDRKREQVERFIERFRAKNTKAAQVQSRIKQLARLEEVAIPERIVTRGKIRLRPPPHCGQEIVRLEGAGLTYDHQRWVLRGVDLAISRGEKIALVGFNGLGKTTLLRMLSGHLPLSEGRRIAGHKVVIGYQSQDFAETMDPDNTVFGTIRSVAMNSTEQEIRTLLGGFGFPGDDIDKKVTILSGGEKIRLAFARLLIEPPNFLVLDEPTTHLDIQACEALETALQGYQGTLCLVSHDIDFVRHVATGIIAMTPPGITRYPGGYDYYHQKMLEAEARSLRGEILPAARKAGGDGAAGRTGKQVDKKALRRERAIERQKLYERTKELKKEVQRAEQQVAVFAAEQAQLTNQLSGNPEEINFPALNKRLKSVQKEIERYTQRWEQAALELEQITASKDEPADE